MKIENFINAIKNHNIDTISGVPDSTLKVMCDYLNSGKSGMQHYIMPDEGGALAFSLGHYLASGNVACVYMQNSGIGNVVNPLTSLVNEKVYKVPVLFIIGWRGEPETKDEPQHKFMGEITTPILDVLGVSYSVIDNSVTYEELDNILVIASDCLKNGGQYALIIKKGTFEEVSFVTYKNQNKLIREDAVCTLLKYITNGDLVVSTTGKISREFYENSDKIYGKHDNIFMSVGGMGYANMIAYGVADICKDRKIYCVDGDGALLMHMGNMQFLGSNKAENYIHICLNNSAHESVGGMPTANCDAKFAKIALQCGYKYSVSVSSNVEFETELIKTKNMKGPIFIEVSVAIGSREDLVRPKESAEDNKNIFMKLLDNSATNEI